MVLLRIASIVALARTAQALHHVSPSTRRRFAAYAANNNGDDARRVVFLGSPGPPAPKGRKRALAKSEVHELAEARGVPCLTPASARDPEFLAALEALDVDLCVTAAYGQFLPKAFLAIPKHGTMNVHPSLLPRWRGAAPLQRSLEAGDAEVGVTVLRTVLKMDAGPVAAQRTRAVEDGDDCAALLDELFGVGAQLLVDDVMPGLWDGTLECVPRDGDLATEAPKLTKDEGALDLGGPGDDGRSAARRAADKVQPANRKPMDAAAYWNGLRGDARTPAA
ncbi:methionyl-tRNA formyltransferase [Aureococcus anophagefferens]|nr:methionyl-tRNA formyltransferase [Aureococcus anophagefferens]